MFSRPEADRNSNLESKVQDLESTIQGLESKIKTLETSVDSKKILLKDIVIPNIGSIIVLLLVFLASLGLNISEITNQIFKNFYTPKFIYSELVNTEESRENQNNSIIDISQVAAKDENSHKDILEITKKWDGRDYRNFVKNGDDENSYGYLFDALRKEYEKDLNRLLSNSDNKFENAHRFNREFAGSTINVKIERLGIEGIPDKCGGDKITQEDLKVIFVYSKTPTDQEKILDCPGINRPLSIFIRLNTSNGITRPIKLVGINEIARPEKPIVRITDAVAAELGWSEEQLQEFRGTLEIMYSSN